MSLIIRILLYFVCFVKCGIAEEVFLSQPTKVITSIGSSALITCRLRSGNANRSWYINGSFTSESNLPSGIFSLQSGIFIAGEYSKYYNQTNFVCSSTVYVGPPKFLETHNSTTGTLIVIGAANPNGQVQTINKLMSTSLLIELPNGTSSAIKPSATPDDDSISTDAVVAIAVASVMIVIAVLLLLSLPAGAIVLKRFNKKNEFLVITIAAPDRIIIHEEQRKNQKQQKVV